MPETVREMKMPRFIRVTKDNRNKDRGFIVVDAICAVFERQDAHNTEIMTIDGFWYEVVDGIEKVYADVYGGCIKQNDVNLTDKIAFAKRMRFKSPAASESSVQIGHEEARETKKSCFSYPKNGYSTKRRSKVRDTRACDFPSGEGEGQHGSRTKAVDFTPHETEGT